MSLQSTATSTTTDSTVVNLQADAVSFLPTSSDLLTPRRVPDTLAVPRARWRRRRCPTRRRWPVVRGRGSLRHRTASHRLPRPYRPRLRPNRDGLVMCHSRRLCPARCHPHNRRQRQIRATSLWRHRHRTSAVRNQPKIDCVAADRLSADEVAWAFRLQRIGVLGDRKHPCRWTGFPRPGCWGRQTGPNNARLGYHGRRWILQTLPVCDDVMIHRRPVYLHEMFRCGDVVVFVRSSSSVTSSWFLISVWMDVSTLWSLG